jgi:hypothetical protein
VILVPNSADILEVSRADLSVTRLIRAEIAAPEPGEVLFEVERFGLSANNVTYALLGDALRYWDLFPAAPGWGRIPVWGYLRVLDSAVPGVEPGRRAFGLGPMATHVLLRPGRAGQATFTEGSAHRAGLSSVYNVYAWVPPGLPADDALLVLRPLFWLSFTLDDHLARRPDPARPVIVTSASSKAALGLAHLLTRRGVPVTGLTSAGRVAFVDGLRSYGQVLSYDQVAALPVADATVVDIAGDAAVRDQIARRLKGPAEVVVAGGTHGAAGDLAAGAFSAPRYIRDLARERGWPELERRYQAALADFAAGARAWLEIVRHRGLDAAARVYREVRAGAGPSAAAHVVDPVLRP